MNIDEAQEKQPHYVCTGGCYLVSDQPGKCVTRGCVRNRNPLAECNCADGQHGDLPEKNKPKDL